MYLDKILGSTTKINVLSVLVSNPEKTYFEKELANESGCSLSEINRQIKDLVNSSLVILQRVAKVNTYKINQRHFLFKALLNLFKNLNMVYREIAKALIRFIIRRHHIRAVILMGSLSKEAIRDDIVTAPSDIDILFVAEKEDAVEKIRQDLIRYINSDISMKYGIAIYPIVISAEEYKRELANNPLIIGAQAKGEIMYGTKPRRTG